MKYKDGQIESVGDSCAEVDPQVWKQFKEKEFILTNLCF
jgi:hypothetical protein